MSQWKKARADSSSCHRISDGCQYMEVMGVVVERGGVVVIMNAKVVEVAGMDVEVAAMILVSK